MITILDTTDTLHKVCPRCGGDWQAHHAAESFDCTKCQMRAFVYARKPLKHFFVISIFSGKKNYEIYWIKDRCTVYTRSTEGANNMHNMDLPSLPFDISIQKLQTYLVFS